MKKVIQPGSQGGGPKDGFQVTVHYKTELQSGKLLESTWDLGEPFRFKVGVGQVLKAWDLAVKSMSKGEIAHILVHPRHLAGSTRLFAEIPPNEYLQFTIELLSFETEIQLVPDGGITKSVVADGARWELPLFESTCHVSYRMSGMDGTLFEEARKAIRIGDDDLPAGMENAIQTMKIGEHAVFKIKGEYAFGAEGNKALKIGPHTDIIFDVKLDHFTKEKEFWEMESFTEKENVAMARKNEGNKFFNASKFNLAIKKYQKALSFFKSMNDLSPTEKGVVESNILLPCYLNLAAAFLKTSDYKEAKSNAKHALSIDPKSVKALWRLGCAQTELGEWEDAKKCFEDALQIEPDNKAVKASSANLKKLISEQNKAKNMYKNFFT
uniref:peptidylprolyl isomerase n=1 Tax=Arcella intermedia TaxID=1963864 RepID=A0A6B2L6K6_9EUKA